MKYIALLIFCLSCFFCNAQKQTDYVISLNGDWKFHVIDGQGSNPLNVVEESSDIIIDNRNTNQVEIKGNWKLKTEGARGSAVYQKDFIERNFSGKETEANYVRFFPKFKKSGYYEAFVMMPFGTHLTAQVNVKQGNLKETAYLNQRVRCGQWISLGIFNFDSTQENYVELTAITEGSVTADAVLFKCISETAYLKAKNEPKQVFLTNYNDSNWFNLKVPGHWGMLNSYSNYVGKAWYRKTFDLPKDWKKNANDKIRLQFAAVYHLSNVYVNGQFVGKNQGGFTPFEFDITDKLYFDKPNLIAVEVDNNFLVGATWNWGGIIREVQLVKNQSVRIQNQYMNASPDLKTGTADLNLKVFVENNSSISKSVAIQSVISYKKKLITLTAKATIAPNVTQEVVLNGKLNAKQVQLWHFDNPVLYHLNTNLSIDKMVVDTKTNPFGIRKIEINASQMLLNGEPVRLGGFNRVSEHRYWGSSEPIELLVKDIHLMKEAGANFMRIMHGTQNEKLIQLCDEKGILIFEEVNVRDLTNPEFDAPKYTLPRQWIKGMIERDWNHPSIIGWSVGNELSDHNQYARDMMKLVRELDPNRLVTCVSNTGQKASYTPENDPNSDVDMIMHNMYAWQGKPLEILATLRKKWPNKPIFLSEYGFDPFPTASLDNDRAEVTDWHNNFRGKNDFVIGASLWTFNDYRSGYAATSAEENRVWGVVNVWRQKRRLFDRLKHENSPLNTIEVTDIDFDKKSAQVKLVVKGPKDYPSFSLRNYQLVWRFKDNLGRILFENRKSLPLITPSQGEWKGTIKWKGNLTNAQNVTIEVVNSLGYSRADKVFDFTVPNSPVIKQIISGDGKARILFDSVSGATEYGASYENEKGEVVVLPTKTIANYIDLEGLENNKSYLVSVFSFNQKGKSFDSKKERVTPNGKLLPPVIWDAFIRDKKIVIGYSSENEDNLYEVHYGRTPTNLDKNFTTNVRGMLSIEIDDNSIMYFKIRRKTKDRESNWSELKLVNSKTY
ncbi:glycoside hydrolase family 2 TIM barrel-domain containing protein [Flavobacterium sp. UMI-01]|uniref:glycoside hydrolase family 2 TIM barrel-domain containing protein n=1 Tax=Flavobacterium sp. UMI-01 TaxID=1441053 RepID=UPI001C7DBA82|nr:glycoside hydrolase family 2 TIM barrel-domain containing protein [Flavobacterium sp. UMI-01]GIZ09661.1 hypothetical protein FUMI01_23880 [Flavobacterium sp. UMI-01]